MDVTIFQNADMFKIFENKRADHMWWPALFFDYSLSCLVKQFEKTYLVTSNKISMISPIKSFLLNEHLTF